MHYSPSTKGFYDNVNKAPADAVEITEALWLQLLEAECAGQVIMADENGMPYSAPRPPKPLAEVIEHKRKLINAAYNAAMLPITGPYPQAEIDGFQQQQEEAKAYRVAELDGTPEPTDFPLLNALATQSGHTLESRVERVEQKAAFFKTFYGSLTGKRHALENALDAIDLEATDARDQITAIDESELAALAVQLTGG